MSPIWVILSHMQVMPSGQALLAHSLPSSVLYLQKHTQMDKDQGVIATMKSSIWSGPMTPNHDFFFESSGVKCFLMFLGSTETWVVEKT